MAEFPLDPMLAKTIIASEEYKVLPGLCLHCAQSQARRKVASALPLFTFASMCLFGQHAVVQ